MAQPVKTGTAIYEDTFRRTELPTLVDLDPIDDDPMTYDADKVQALMAKQAMRAMQKDRNEAINLVNGFKDDFGNGVSTRVLVYNALGIPLKYRSDSDDSGRWSTHTLADRIEVGEWAIAFHRKKGASFAGSSAIVAYNLQGYGDDEVLMIGFNTPYSGRNTALCKVMSKKVFHETPYKEMHGWVEKSGRSGNEIYGRALVKYSTDSESSPTLNVVVTRSDIGY